MGALMACTEGSQAALLLARLEGTPREEWEVVVDTWERWQQQERERLVAIGAEEKRQAEQQDAPGRVFACIDRALEMHSARQQAAAKEEAEAAAAKGGSPAAASPRLGPARSGRRVRPTTPPDPSSDSVSAQSSVAAAEPPPQPQQQQQQQPAKAPLTPTPPTTPAKGPGARADPIDISKLKSEGLGGGGSCASPAWLATRADGPDGCTVAATATATTTARQPPPRPRRLAARAA